jgi:Skp family chaperone for outer membrane proteins
MKKRLFLILMLCAGFSFSSWATKTGTVSIQKIYSGISEGKSIIEKVKSFYISKQMELKKEGEKITKAQASFQKQSLLMNEKTKLEKQNELKNMILGFKKKEFLLQREVQSFEKGLRAPIEIKIMKIIEKISKNEEIDLAFEVTAGRLIYAKNRVDLTDKVIAEYNKIHPMKKK